MSQVVYGRRSFQAEEQLRLEGDCWVQSGWRPSVWMENSQGGRERKRELRLVMLMSFQYAKAQGKHSVTINFQVQKTVLEKLQMESFTFDSGF